MHIHLKCWIKTNGLSWIRVNDAHQAPLLNLGTRFGFPAWLPEGSEAAAGLVGILAWGPPQRPPLVFQVSCRPPSDWGGLTGSRGTQGGPSLGGFPGTRDLITVLSGLSPFWTQSPFHQGHKPKIVRRSPCRKRGPGASPRVRGAESPLQPQQEACRPRKARDRQPRSGVTEPSQGSSSLPLPDPRAHGGRGGGGRRQPPSSEGQTHQLRPERLLERNSPSRGIMGWIHAADQRPIHGSEPASPSA